MLTFCNEYINLIYIHIYVYIVNYWSIWKKWCLVIKKVYDCDIVFSEFYIFNVKVDLCKYCKLFIKKKMLC